MLSRDEWQSAACRMNAARADSLPLLSAAGLLDAITPAEAERRYRQTMSRTPDDYRRMVSDALPPETMAALDRQARTSARQDFWMLAAAEAGVLDRARTQ